MLIYTWKQSKSTHSGFFWLFETQHFLVILPFSLFADRNNESCARLLRCGVRSESAVHLIRQHSCYKLHVLCALFGETAATWNALILVAVDFSILCCTLVGFYIIIHILSNRGYTNIMTSTIYATIYNYYMGRRCESVSDWLKAAAMKQSFSNNKWKY